MMDISAVKGATRVTQNDWDSQNWSGSGAVSSVRSQWNDALKQQSVNQQSVVSKADNRVSDNLRSSLGALMEQQRTVEARANNMGTDGSSPVRALNPDGSRMDKVQDIGKPVNKLENVLNVMNAARMLNINMTLVGSVISKFTQGVTTLSRGN